MNEPQPRESMQKFTLPAGLIGKFGVVKLWPGVKVAEDEVIARLKRAAEKLGLTCYEITPDGRLMDAPNVRMTRKDLDFVIHLHFETPKAYDLFSFCALWNPLQFYHDYLEGAYRRLTDNVLSHDDFLSCGSASADDHVRRLLAHDPSRDDIRFTMYHSLAEPIIPPTLGEQKIFYAGINWERLGKKPSRHQALLDLLDRTGELRIYGPQVLMGVKVWDGYKSYSGQIPFDGVAMVREIARAGVSLVLSSAAHKEAELMSSRLFESIAGGAVIICDDNPFARRHFGDTLLYIDCTCAADETAQQVREHMRWIRKNPEAALAKANAAQAIFKEKFTLDRSLADLYTALPMRGAQLLPTVAAPEPPVTLLLQFSYYDEEALKRLLESAAAQTYANLQPILLLPTEILEQFEARIRKQIAALLPQCQIKALDFHHRLNGKKIERALPFGRVLQQVLTELPTGALVMLINDREQLFAEHVQMLVAALARTPGAQTAYGAYVQKTQQKERTQYLVQKQVNLFGLPGGLPFCTGRFLFRNPPLQQLATALPYLDTKALALLAATGQTAASTRVTMVQEVDAGITGIAPELGKAIEVEDEIIRDFLPPAQRALLSPQLGAEQRRLEPQALSLQNLTAQNRAEIARDIFLGIPLPGWMQRGVLGFYHFLRNLR